MDEPIATSMATMDSMGDSDLPAGLEPVAVVDPPAKPKRQRRQRTRIAETLADEPEPVKPLTIFDVELPYLRKLTIEAASEDEAFAKYKAASGVIDSDHPPKIVRV